MGRGTKPFTAVFFVTAFFWAAPFAAALTAAGDARETAPPWEILSRSLSYDSDRGVYQAEGEVTISRENQVLSSDSARYYERTGVTEVPGPFRLDFNGDVLTGRDGTLQLEENTGKLLDGEIFLRESNMYIRAREIEKLGENRYFITGCRVTTCDNDRPVWSISGSEADITLGGYGKVRHGAFRILGVPVLYTPYFVFPVKTERQTGLLPPIIGYSGRRGMDLEVPFFWAVSDSTDATLYQRYMTNRGYMQGMEYRYLASEDSGGTFLLDVMSDRIGVKDLTDPDEIDLSPFERTNTTRYWARGRVDQELPMEIQARLDLDFVSDQDYLREFETGGLGIQSRADLSREWGRPLEEIRSPTRRSAVRLSRDGELHSLQAGMEYHQTPENTPGDTTPHPLAGVLFDLMPRRVFESPLYVGMRSDLDYIWSDSGTTGYRTMASPSMSFPFAAGRYMMVEPFSEYTVARQWFDPDVNGEDTRTKQRYESGIQLSSAFERAFETEAGKVSRLNHRFQPVLTYRYMGRGYVSTPAPWFEPIDRGGRTNRMNLSLRNYLDARYDDEERTWYRQWGYLNLNQGFAIDQARGEAPPGQRKEPFDPLNVRMGINPGANLRGRFSADWDHYDRQITRSSATVDLGVERAGGRRDHYSLDYTHNKAQDSKYLGVAADVYVSRGVSTGVILQRELKSRENITQHAWLAFKRQCWGMKFSVDRSEHTVGFSVMISLKGLGDF